MKYINKISNSSFQEMTLTGNPGQQIRFNLRFLPSQNSWLADVIWNDFTVRGLNICASPNLLNGFKNLLPFGISCITVDGQDPYDIEDFNSGYARLYLLDAADLLTIEEQLFV